MQTKIQGELLGDVFKALDITKESDLTRFKDLTRLYQKAATDFAPQTQYQHNDIHLGNAILTPQGKVELIDFGQSRKSANIKESSKQDLKIANSKLDEQVFSFMFNDVWHITPAEFLLKTSDLHLDQ